MVRFMRFVEVLPNGCHRWTGTTVGSNARYGQFDKVYAHRWIYEQTVGPIPPGLEIDHVVERGCITKLCVNVDHLEPVTHAENRRRGRLAVCRSGRHDLTDPANVRWDKDGNRRGCLLCRNEAERRREQRRTEKKRTLRRLHAV